MTNNLFSRSSLKITSNTFLRKTFLTAGLLFAAICVIGVITKVTVDSTGAISSALQGSSRWDATFLKSSDVSSIKIVFGLGSFLILASWIMSLIWVFRIQKASKAFIAANYIVYALAQGIGFGSLFMVFKAFELIGIFGIAGGIFFVMAAVGFLIKDGTRMVPYLLAGTAVAFVLGIVSMIMYLVGVYSDTLIMIMTFITGLLICGYIAFDIWWIKTTSQYYDLAANPEMEYRLVAFMAFRLASDIVQLIWVVARFWLRSSK